MLVSFKNINNEVVKLLIFKISIHEYISFKYLCDKMGYKASSNSATPKYEGFLQERHFCNHLIINRNSCFFHGILFLHRRKTDKQ